MRQLVHHHDVVILRDLPEIGYMHTFLLTYHPFSNPGNSANACISFEPRPHGNI